MRISLLDANSMRRRLKALIGKHDHISMAVAWGQLTDVADTLLGSGLIDQSQKMMAAAMQMAEKKV